MSLDIRSVSNGGIEPQPKVGSSGEGGALQPLAPAKPPPPQAIAESIGAGTSRGFDATLVTRGAARERMTPTPRPTVPDLSLESFQRRISGGTEVPKNAESRRGIRSALGQYYYNVGSSARNAGELRQKLEKAISDLQNIVELANKYGQPRRFVKHKQEFLDAAVALREAAQARLETLQSMVKQLPAEEMAFKKPIYLEDLANCARDGFDLSVALECGKQGVFYSQFASRQKATELPIPECFESLRFALTDEQVRSCLENGASLADGAEFAKLGPTAFEEAIKEGLKWPAGVNAATIQPYALIRTNPWWPSLAEVKDIFKAIEAGLTPQAYLGYLRQRISLGDAIKYQTAGFSHENHFVPGQTWPGGVKPEDVRPYTARGMRNIYDIAKLIDKNIPPDIALSYLRTAGGVPNYMPIEDVIAAVQAKPPLDPEETKAFVIDSRVPIAAAIKARDNGLTAADFGKYQAVGCTTVDEALELRDVLHLSAELLIEFNLKNVPLNQAKKFGEAGIPPGEVPRGARWPQILTPQEAKAYRENRVNDLAKMVQLKLAGIKPDVAGPNSDPKISPPRNLASFVIPGPPKPGLSLLGPSAKTKKITADHQAILKSREQFQKSSTLDKPQDRGGAIALLDTQLANLRDLDTTVDQYLKDVGESSNNSDFGVLKNEILRQTRLAQSMKDELESSPVSEWPAGMSLDEVADLRSQGLTLSMVALAKQIAALPADSNVFEGLPNHPIVDVCDLLTKIDLDHFPGLASEKMVALQNAKAIAHLGLVMQAEGCEPGVIKEFCAAAYDQRSINKDIAGRGNSIPLLGDMLENADALVQQTALLLLVSAEGEIADMAVQQFDTHAERLTQLFAESENQEVVSLSFRALLPLAVGGESSDNRAFAFLKDKVDLLEQQLIDQPGNKDQKLADQALTTLEMMAMSKDEATANQAIRILANHIPLMRLPPMKADEVRDQLGKIMSSWNSLVDIAKLPGADQKQRQEAVLQAINVNRSLLQDFWDMRRVFSHDDFGAVILSKVAAWLNEVGAPLR